MNWEGELLDLYEKNCSKAGVIEYKEYEKNGKKERVPYLLLPLFHTTAAAQIEVTIEEEGNFLDASKVSEEDKLTVIPMTENPEAERRERRRIHCAIIYSMLRAIMRAMSNPKRRMRLNVMKCISLLWSSGICRRMRMLRQTRCIAI